MLFRSAYAERVLVEASLTFPVPNGLSVDRAAMTEPMAVALHAVRRSEITKGDTAIVIGCGPVGLAIICHLKAMGLDKIVASDFSPARRALAARCGAQVVVDPSNGSPYDHLGKGVITGAQDLYELAVGSMEKLRKLPGWNHLYRVADKLGLDHHTFDAQVITPDLFDEFSVVAAFDIDSPGQCDPRAGASMGMADLDRSGCGALR